MGGGEDCLEFGVVVGLLIGVEGGAFLVAGFSLVVCHLVMEEEWPFYPATNGTDWVVLLVPFLHLRQKIKGNFLQ
jgi:hypothetical protein